MIIIGAIKTAIANKDSARLKEISRDYSVGEIVHTLEKLSKNERYLFFHYLHSENQPEIFAALPDDLQQELLTEFTDADIRDVVGELYSSQVADLVEIAPEEIGARIIGLATDSEMKQNINQLLKFDDDQTGSVMYVDIVKVKQSWTVAEAIKNIKEIRKQVRIGHYLFCIDAKGVLVGHIAVEDLIFTDGTKHVKDFMKPVRSVYTTTHKSEAAQIFAENDMSMLPVINAQQELVGIIAADDVIDIISESLDKSMQSQAGIVYNDLPYSRTSIITSYKARIVWLLILMIMTTFSSVFLDLFTGLMNGDKLLLGIGASTAIMIIAPVIMGTAGNAGGQASTLIIRGLATGDLSTKDYLKVFRKELVISTMVGLSLALVNILRLVVFFYAFKGGMSVRPEDYVDPSVVPADFNADNLLYLWITLASSLALFIVVILAKTIGAMIPILAKKCKLDPAILSGALVTSILDMSSTIILFGISWGILGAIF